MTPARPMVIGRERGGDEHEVRLGEQPVEVSPELITGAYVSCPESEERLRRVTPELPLTVDPHLFFR